MMKRIKLLMCVFIMLNVGCAKRPSTMPMHVLAKPCDNCVLGIGNFAKISDVLWRGAQPSHQGFVNLEKMGVKTVVSFRHFHDDCALLKGTNLKYIRIPANGFHPEEEDIVKFLKIIEDPDNWPVFVHCYKGDDRAGYSIAAYRMVNEGWNPDDAIAEMFNFNYNPIWFSIPGFLRRLDLEEIKEKVWTEPKPRFNNCE